MSANTLEYREAWLHAVADQLRPIFASHGAIVPVEVRLTCGFPSTRAFAAKRQRVGECWSGEASADGHIEIMISPVLDDPVRVAGVLAHELVHAIGAPAREALRHARQGHRVGGQNDRHHGG